jgi:hypothetical protein
MRLIFQHLDLDASAALGCLGGLSPRSHSDGNALEEEGLARASPSIRKRCDGGGSSRLFLATPSRCSSTPIPRSACRSGHRCDGLKYEIAGHEAEPYAVQGAGTNHAAF